MSLIIDALKKTQQLRLPGTENAPLFIYPDQNKTGRRNSGKRWIVTGASLLCFCILLFAFLRPPSSPLATQTNGPILSLETRPSAPVPKKDEPNEGSHYFEASIPAADKTPSKAPNEAPSLPKDEAPSPARQALDPASGGASSSKKAGIQGIRNAGAALHGPPSHRTLERMPTATLSSVSEAEEESQVKQDLTRPPMTQKEEVLPKPIVVEQERKKEHSSTLDALRHFNSGVTFYNQKEFAKAIQAYRKAIELDPTNFEAYNNLGILYQMLGDTKSALTAYQKSTDTNPMYEKGYNNLGLLFLLEGHYEEALEVFQKVLGINANNIESHINLGVLFKKQGQWEKAIECYQKALAINPLHRETHYNMALLYEQLEKWELAISHYQQFVQLSSKSYPELVLRVQRRLNALAAAKGNKNP